MSISVGAVGTASAVVTPENTAAAVGSGALPVFATPYMIALMENAACNAIADGLEEGQSSVGTKLDVSHDAATPVGMHVTARAELVEVDRRRLVFRVTAEDDAGPIGQGTHERFLIMADKFLAKAEAKKPKQTRKTTQKQKKPSIRAQLAAAKEEQKKKPPAREKSKEMEV